MVDALNLEAALGFYFQLMCSQGSRYSTSRLICISGAISVSLIGEGQREASLMTRSQNLTARHYTGLIFC